ncbi:HEAT repeat domain-containing protein [Rhodococcus sp. SGAir0479]|uniref:HEAT repeat domain-containing protein n=1 Tax=Rhodococcus sp. SGAir0479 TaxID=2567884 RepID=UPI0010CD1A75|nr:HEAT repeat domain-containing protein [Rhodococcus sp. SGAir0479]QCQ90250.1 HEAT repeat domain-containing protein [Rhodococcus sp. SGAir0479]
MSRAQWRAELQSRDPSAWAAFLTDHSGLPGPRANTDLALAVAEVADTATIERLLGADDEYLLFCGAVGLARRIEIRGALPRVRALAADDRWRIREAVAMGLQLLGDNDVRQLCTLCLEWSKDPDPLLRRAAVAALCEPRLLRSPDAAAVAVQVCRNATDSIAALAPEDRRERDVRTLRQALGYCWSVAVAANPEPGLAAFAQLDESDPDLRWIVIENKKKRRLARLLG